MIKPSSFSIFGIDNKFETFSKNVCIFIEGFGTVGNSWFDTDEYNNSEYKVLINCTEPPELTARFFSHQDIIDNSSRFDLILTSHADILNTCSNAVLFPFGSGWVQPIPDDISKRDEISFLCGSKNFLTGHSLRQRIYQQRENISTSLDKKFYHTYPGKKDDILYPSLFSIIVENTQHENYFTEKIIDCMLAKCIPIYWGCPNIGNFFNQKGIIKFNDIEELIAKANLLTREVYQSRLSIIEENFTKALVYRDFHKRVSDEISKRL